MAPAYLICECESEIMFNTVNIISGIWDTVIQPKAKNAFLALKWPYQGQPDNHIGWETI